MPTVGRQTRDAEGGKSVWTLKGTDNGDSVANGALFTITKPAEVGMSHYINNVFVGRNEFNTDKVYRIRLLAGAVVVFETAGGCGDGTVFAYNFGGLRFPPNTAVALEVRRDDGVVNTHKIYPYMDGYTLSE